MSEREEIDNPVKVRVDEDGRRLMVINKGGHEIRIYLIPVVNVPNSKFGYLKKMCKDVISEVRLSQRCQRFIILHV